MAGKDASVPLDQVPRRMMMAVFDLQKWAQARAVLEQGTPAPEGAAEGTP
jgi:hypothetical protein